VLWIRIRKELELVPDPELEASGSGSIPENGCKHKQKPSKKEVILSF
jgi:hypothetical protein